MSDPFRLRDLNYVLHSSEKGFNEFNLYRLGNPESPFSIHWHPSWYSCIVLDSEIIAIAVIE